MDKRTALRDDYRAKERVKIGEEKQAQQAEWDQHRRMTKAEAMDDGEIGAFGNL